MSRMCCCCVQSTDGSDLELLPERISLPSVGIVCRKSNANNWIVPFHFKGPPPILPELSSADRVPPQRGEDAEERQKTVPSTAEYSTPCYTPLPDFQLPQPEALNNVPGTPKQDHLWNENAIQQLEHLGRGSFGRVYKVVHLLTREVVAMKVLRRRKTPRQYLLHVEYEEAIWNIACEHPYVVKLLNKFSIKKRWALIAEYVSGGTLRSVIKKIGVLSKRVVQVFTAQISSAICFIHKKGILHRDVSNLNILVGLDGKAKLTDFGSAIVSLTSRGMHGSMLYQSPQVIQGDESDHTADWFSLGACLYEMVMGMTPLEFHCMKYDIDFAALDFTGRVVVALSMSVYILEDLPDSTKAILNLLLQREQDQRFGHDEESRYFGCHSFFSGINWEELENGTLCVPLEEEGFDFRLLLTKN